MAELPDGKRGRGWGRPFTKGKSGNPNGRPKKKLENPAQLAKTLLEGEAGALTEKAVEMAIGGDRACLRMCLERLLPVKKDSPIAPGLPKIGAAADVPRFLAAATARLEEGEIGPSEAKALKELADSYRKLIETAELEPRVTELEAMANQQGL